MDTPEGALLALCGKPVKHAVAKLQALDGRSYLHNPAHLLARISVGLDNKTPDHPQ